MATALVLAVGLGALPARTFLLGPRAARCPRATLRLDAASATTVTVRRGPGGLGIDVDSDNLIVDAPGQPDLRAGDVVVAVDGEALDGRYLGGVIAPEAEEYSFTVDRDPARSAAALEKALLLLGTDLEAPDVTSIHDQERRDRVEKVVAALERIAGDVGPKSPAEAEALARGFWKLLLASGGAMEGGASGMATSPACSLVAQWQGFSDGEPSAQTVEVIADLDLGRHNVAALKGDLVLEAGSGSAPAAARETYGRLEVGGSLSSSAVISRGSRWTYLSDQLRVCRPEADPAEGEAPVFWCYWRTTPEAAQTEIADLAAAPVAGAADEDEDDMPIWERRAREDRFYDDDAQSAIP